MQIFNYWNKVNKGLLQPLVNQKELRALRVMIIDKMVNTNFKRQGGSEN
jgi:hypothetical protein